MMLQDYMLNVVARALIATAQLAIMATSAHLYSMPVPCQHMMSRSNVLHVESVHIRRITALVKT